MKVLHLIDSGGLYGAEVVLLNLMSEQVRNGLNPVLFSIGQPQVLEKPLEIEAKNRKLEVVRMRIRKGLNLLGASRIIRSAREFNIDIIHCHGYKANILMGMLPKYFRSIPTVSTLHGWTTTSLFSRKAFIQLLDAVCLKKADRTVVVTKALVDHPLIKFLRLYPSIVNNGIPEIIFDLDSAKRLDPILFDFCKKNFVVGSIGRLSAEKGFDYLIEAFSICIKKGADGKLVILGDGSERGRLEALIARRGLNRHVILPGYRNKAIQFLPLFDIFVLSSFTEGLPLTLLEAMQAGRPCVATKVGGVTDVLDHGDCGILVKPRNAEELSMGITFLYNFNQQREKFGVLSRNRVLMEFSVERMAQNYFTIYAELLRGA